MADPEVKAFQIRYKEVGLYDGEPDGDFGPKSLAAALKAVSGMPAAPKPAPVAEVIPPATPDGLMGVVMPLLKRFEGLKTEAYWDGSGQIWTIGIGTTFYPNGERVKQGDKCTEAQAAAYCKHDVESIRLPTIKKLVKVPLSDKQTAALVSFVYNLGIGAFEASSLLKAINAKAPASEITRDFEKYNKSGGSVLAGLVVRRREEARLFTA